MAATEQQVGRPYYIANCIERAINAAGRDFPLRRKVIEEIADLIDGSTNADFIHGWLVNLVDRMEKPVKKQQEQAP